MEQQSTQKHKPALSDVRESFSARLLSNSQFDEAVAITVIIEREIVRSGTFKEKLGDYAHAFARTEKFDSAKADTIIRDIFRSRVGQSMNEMREDMVKREEALTPEQKSLGLDFAIATGQMIEKGDKMTFSRAYAHQGQLLGRELGITDAGAKRLIKEEFQAAESADFYEWGKGLEEKFYRPQVEAERQRGSSRKPSDADDEAPDRTRGRQRAEDSAGREARSRDQSTQRAPSRSRVGLER